MRFSKILDTTDFTGLYVICYTSFDDKIWEGRWSEIPYWLSKMELDCEDKELSAPIEYRSSLGDKYNNKPGLVISLKG